MIPFLTGESQEAKEAQGEVISGLLQNAPSNTCIWQVFQDEEILAFLVAFAPPGAKHVFLSDAWASPKLEGSGVQDRIFLRLVLWAESLGRDRITAETSRHPEGLLRRWNFKEIARIVSFEISEDFEARLLSGKRDVLLGKPETLATKVTGGESEEDEKEEEQVERISNEQQERREQHEDDNDVKPVGQPEASECDSGEVAEG